MHIYACVYTHIQTHIFKIRTHTHARADCREGFHGWGDPCHICAIHHIVYTRRSEGRASMKTRRPIILCSFMYMIHYALCYMCTHLQIGGKSLSEDETPNYIISIMYIKYCIPYYTRAHTQVGGKGFLQDETPNYIIHIVHIRGYYLISSAPELSW